MEVASNVNLQEILWAILGRKTMARWLNQQTLAFPMVGSKANRI